MTISPDDPRDDRAMTAEQALRTLGLVADGRPVEPAVRARAEAYAAEHPGVRAELADQAAIREVLASEPAPVPAADFTDRVLAARSAPDPASGRILSLARRLSVAAALLLAVTVGGDLANPERAVADPSIEDQPHAVDAFGRDPFRAGDLDAGLQALFPDPARRGSASAHASLTEALAGSEDGEG